jgi:hypothetical protein
MSPRWIYKKFICFENISHKDLWENHVFFFKVPVERGSSWAVEPLSQNSLRCCFFCFVCCLDVFFFSYVPSFWFYYTFSFCCWNKRKVINYIVVAITKLNTLYSCEGRRYSYIYHHELSQSHRPLWSVWGNQRVNRRNFVSRHASSFERIFSRFREWISGEISHIVVLPRKPENGCISYCDHNLTLYLYNIVANTRSQQQKIQTKVAVRSSYFVLYRHCTVVATCPIKRKRQFRKWHKHSKCSQSALCFLSQQI